MLDLLKLDDDHLRALSKALHEARFCLDADDPVVWSSPLVVDLHVWTLQEQRTRDQASGRAAGWDGWLSWAGRPETTTVVRRLRAAPGLLAKVTDDPRLLRDLLRPFVVEDADLVAMIDAAGAET